MSYYIIHFDNMFRTNCVHHQVNKVSIKNVSLLQCYIENYISMYVFIIIIILVVWTVNLKYYYLITHNMTQKYKHRKGVFT
jgi:hypothetical protein